MQSRGYTDFGAIRGNAGPASALLKAMANERRLLILCYLAEAERSVGELEELIGISQSALSQHLARLRQDDLVIARRSAQNIYYSLAGHQARDVMLTLHDIFCQTSHDGGIGVRAAS